jgi:hypothetical protein
MKQALLFALLFLAGPLQAADESTVVARIFDKQVTAGEIGLRFDSEGAPVLPDHEATCVVKHPVAELQSAILREIQAHYIRIHNLTATDDEVLEMKTFQDKFMAQDRIRRQRDLEKVEAQLAENHLPAPEREKLESRLATLQSLAGHEKNRENMPELTPEMNRMIHAPWIEAWKYHQAIYEEFGGVVSGTKFGPDPVGAKQALARQLEETGELAITNQTLKEAFWKSLAAPPRFAVEKDAVDFTPFWRQPAPDDEMESN